MSIIHNFFVLSCSSTKFLFLHEQGISMVFNLILFISSGIPFLFPSQFHSRIFAHKGHWRALAMKKNCPYTHGAPDRWFFLLILSRLDIQALLLSWLHQLFQFAPGSHDSSHSLGCSLPNFDSKLGWFSRQVLFEWKPSFEGNHALIHTLLSERMVIFHTFVTNLVHTWSHMT